MLYETDPYLLPYKKDINMRMERILIAKGELVGYKGKLSDAANNHLYYGVQADSKFVYFREWAPGAKEFYVIGDFNNWQIDQEFKMTALPNGNWELVIDISKVKDKQLFKWKIKTSKGEWIERLPAYARRCVQDPSTKIFSAQLQLPSANYVWKHTFTKTIEKPIIYEVHIGMSSEGHKVSSFKEFAKDVLPHIIETGYNTIQIMALQEHPYYGSFGYQVSNFFALSSRFGTAEDFKELVDTAHANNIAVVMDIVHSHAVKNQQEGISCLDGSYDLYFHSGTKGEHPAWGTRCFNYGKDQVIRFLLSNCKFWLQEYNLDGFRFDGITSMLYFNHGLAVDFNGYPSYFTPNTDTDAYTYLALANLLIKEIKPNAITIAEDMSGMPGLASPVEQGGAGFNFRMSMGIPDKWIKWIKELPDQLWDMGNMWYELTNKRDDEKTISYVECHDQSLVGDKTIIFRLIDSLMYTHMSKQSNNLIVDRGIALHKMIRLLTLLTAADGYLTFMGNEFGHPEWVDFPRQGNNWSYNYARRQWQLCYNKQLYYSSLYEFEKSMIALFKKEHLLDYKPISIFNDIKNQVMLIQRGSLIFVFNFSPTNSYNNYPVNTTQQGEYRIVLDTDWREFSGFERNERTLTHSTIENKKIFIYAPSRTAFALKI